MFLCVQVLLAVGRKSSTSDIGLECVGVQCNQECVQSVHIHFGFNLGAEGFVKVMCVCVSSLCVCSTGRILVNERDETSVDNIYAIGSVQHGRPSTTGLSVHSGTLLARRLYRDDNILVHSLEIVTLIVPYSL